MDVLQFLEWATSQGLEYFRIYPGVYRALVVRTDDPEERGRVQLRCPAVGHGAAPNVWVPPASTGAGVQRGQFWPPEVGDSVYVSFRLGNAGRPQCYWGGWYGEGEVPTEFAYTGGQPKSRGWVTRGGHRLVFNDADGAQSVEIAWHKPAAGDESLSEPTVDARLTSPAAGAATADRSGGLTARLTIDSNGSIRLEDAEGNIITLDAASKKVEVGDVHGNVFRMSSAGVEVESSAISLGSNADSPVPRWLELKTWLRGHKHPSAWGETGPPTVPPPENIGSSVVKLK